MNNVLFIKIIRPIQRISCDIELACNRSNTFSIFYLILNYLSCSWNISLIFCHNSVYMKIWIFWLNKYFPISHCFIFSKYKEEIILDWSISRLSKSVTEVLYIKLAKLGYIGRVHTTKRERSLIFLFPIFDDVL